MMFGGLTIDKRCEKSPRIAPRAPIQANTPFKSASWQSQLANGEWFLGKLAISELFHLWRVSSGL